MDRKPLFRDIATVIWKEWRELTSAAGTGSTSRVNLVGGAFLLAVVAALAAYIGPELIASPAVMSASMIAFVILMASIVDAFPGERERHTLETLLASALPDEALLLGKILTSVLYGWLVTLLLLATLLVGVNVTHPGTMYPLSTLVTALVGTPLMLLFFSSAGVLLSMRSPTVRAAQPRMAALFLGLFLPIPFVQALLPIEWKQHAIELMRSETGRLQAAASQIAFFAVVDLVLLALALARFKRSRLL